MKHIMGIKKCSVINILFLLLLVSQEYSSYQNALTNGESNYGLNNDEFRAMLFGLNYDSVGKNRNNLEKRKNVENESLFFRNFTNEETPTNVKNEKAQTEVQSMNNSKRKAHSSQNNDVGNNNSSNQSENKSEHVELKSGGLLQKSFEKDKINKRYIPNNNSIDKNQPNSVFKDTGDLGNTNVIIHNNDSANKNLSNNGEHYTTYENDYSSDKKYNNNSNSKKGDDTSATPNDYLTNNIEKTNLELDGSKKMNNYVQKAGDMKIEKYEPLQKDLNVKGHIEELLDEKKLKSGQISTEKKSKISKDIVHEGAISNELTKIASSRLSEKPNTLIEKENDLKKANLPELQDVKKDLLKNDEKNEDGIKMTYLENSNNNKQHVQNSVNNENVKSANTMIVGDSNEHNMIYSEEDINAHIKNSQKDMLKSIKPVQFDESTYNKLNDDSSKSDENKILNKINKSNENIFFDRISLKKGAKDINEYKYFKLKSNDFKVLGIINKYSSRGGFSISVDCGGYDDFDEIPGISNLLQHAIFYKSEKRNTTLLSELGKYSSEHNGHSTESFTNYYAISHSEDIYHLLNLFAENLFYPVFNEENIENEVKEISNKYISMENNLESCLKIASQYITDFKYSKFFINGNYTTLCENVLKHRLSIKRILAEFHKKCYQPKNMSLTILLGNKGNPADHYNMNDIENMIVHIFGKIKNDNHIIDGDVIETPINHMKLEWKSFNGRKENYNNTNFTHEEQNGLSNDARSEKEHGLIQSLNEIHYVLDLDQKNKYIEILKKEEWANHVYLYWSSKTNIDLCKKIEEFGSMTFLHEIFSDFRKSGFYYKISVENKYIYDLKVTSTCNKYYLNFGILVKLTQKGKSNIAHLIHICNVFVNEISKLFDRDSLDKGINKYLLDYYREKALLTDLNFNSDSVGVSLNDLIIYSNKLLIYADDPSSLLTIHNLIEDKNKNDFRNHIKITSLVGSLIKNENLNIINVVDTFNLTNHSQIPNTTIKYAIGESPYLIGQGGITNDINITFPEINTCALNSFENNSASYEKSFYCVPYNSSENFEFPETEPMFISEENKNEFKENIICTMPCLIKSSYGYNIYFKRGLTDASKVKSDFIFYFPSERLTFYEAIFSRIHIIILTKKIKVFLADYVNCSVNVNIKRNAESYIIHMDTGSYYFEDFFNKIGDLLSVKETPSKEEFDDAYDELNMYVKSSRKLEVGNSLNIMYSLFNEYEPTDKEMDDILNAYFFYPSYNDYTKYVNGFFHRNYINIFIYGNVIIPTGKEGENAASYINHNINNGGSGVINNPSNNTISNADSIDKYKYNMVFYEKTNNKGNNALYLKKRDNNPELQKNFEKQAFIDDSLQISHNGLGIEYLVNLSEAFIKKVTNDVLKKSESTYYTRKLVNNENVEVDIPIVSQNVNSSIIVSYIIESESVLSDTLIDIIVNLISPDFAKFSKTKYNDGYVVEVKRFSTRYGLGGLLFVIQSFDNDVEKLEAHICTFVKYVTFELMNIEISDLVKKLESMKEYYMVNNGIFTFDQEYYSILDQLTSGMECFDKKYKIIKIFDELINCPKIILNKVNVILKNSKKAIFKGYKTVNPSYNKKEEIHNANSYSCNYSHKAREKLSNVQLTESSRLVKKKRSRGEKNLRNDKFRMNKLHKKDNFITVSNFVEMKKKGFFQYVIDYFKNSNNMYLDDSNYFDFKSCEEEMSKSNFHVFYNFTNDIGKIRAYFLQKFANDKEIREKCSVDYEEIRQYCSMN